MQDKSQTLLQAAAHASERSADPQWRPDIDDDQALELAAQIGAVISFDDIANAVAATHKVSGKTETVPTAGDPARAMRMAILRLASSLAPSSSISCGRLLVEIALSPITWLMLLQICLVGSLYLVGYLSVPESEATVRALEELLKVPPSAAKYRAGLAYSGVTLGLTLALAVTSMVWAFSAFQRRGSSFVSENPSPSRRKLILGVVVVLSTLWLVLLLGLSLKPFPSQLGLGLLKWVYSRPGTNRLAQEVPLLMFLLSIIIPATLAAGASFLQEPIARTAPSTLRRLVALRVRELDHLLYIGALGLVFGILQLSATMSVPLAGLPDLAELKDRAVLCGTLKAELNSNLLFWQARQKCIELPESLALAAAGEGLRELVRAVTLALGLAFSAMLLAVYVPAMVSLRLMLDSDSAEATASVPKKENSSSESLGDADPLHRIAAAAATLAPLIAGLVANMFGSA